MECAVHGFVTAGISGNLMYQCSRFSLPFALLSFAKTYDNIVIIEAEEGDKCRLIGTIPQGSYETGGQSQGSSGTLGRGQSMRSELWGLTAWQLSNLRVATRL